MKTLTIALCMLLMVVPAGAQQTAISPKPNFYVPYGVRDVSVEAMEMQSSSADSSPARLADPGQRTNASMHRHYPRRRAYRAYRPGYGPLPPPQLSTVAEIAGAIVVVVALVGLAVGDR